MHLLSRLILSALLTIGFAFPVTARQWASSDGGRTFDGKLVEYRPPHVTVKKPDGKLITFQDSVLSRKDVYFCQYASQFLKGSILGTYLKVEEFYEDGISCQSFAASGPQGELIFVWGDHFHREMKENESFEADLFRAGTCTVTDRTRNKELRAYSLSLEDAISRTTPNAPPPDDTHPPVIKLPEPAPRTPDPTPPPTASPPPEPDPPTPPDGQQYLMGCGTGFAITRNGWVVTNEHVIRGCKTVTLHHEGKTATAGVAFIDVTNDLALLKTNVETIPLSIAFSEHPRLGDPITVGGFPNPDVQGVSLKLTRGIISSLNGIMDDQRHYQIDAAIQPGNSGGPLLDERGRVVGIVQAKLDDAKSIKNFGFIPQNVNYCIKVSLLHSLLNEVEGLSSMVQLVAEPSGERIGTVLQRSTYLIETLIPVAP